MALGNTALLSLATASTLLGCTPLGPEPSADTAVAAHRGGPRPRLSVYGLGGDRRSCQRSKFRQFDFWLGDWRIATPAGEPRGVSRITKEVGGCAVMEFYFGGAGRSMSRFEQETKTWHQDYIDNTGFTLRLFGGFSDGVMGMKDSVRVIPNVASLFSTFSWTPASDGTVRQRWFLSFDGGTTFQDNFDGIYHPHPAYQDPPPPVVQRCASAPYRDADAMLGSWNVATAEGRQLGTTRLSLGAANCLIEETFLGADGFEQRAFLYYDRFVRTWYRAQVDSWSNTLRVGGTLTDGRFEMNGSVSGHGNRVVPIRLTWAQESSTRLTQQWQAQGHDGDWQPVASLVWTR